MRAALHLACEAGNAGPRNDTIRAARRQERNMPELPEVETIVRTLRPHVEGLYLVKALEVKRPCVLPEGLPLSEAEGLRLDGVSRRGKLILMNLDTGEEGRIMHVVLHLRMTGSLLAQDREAPFDADAMPGMAGKYTRCLFGFARTPEGPCTELVRFDDIRTFGRVLVGGDGILESWPFWKKLGPEPLEMSADEFVRRLRGRRQVKTMLLDQTVIAGIGNIYADESLFRAGIHPAAPADRLGDERKRKLFDALQYVLRLSIRECGSSIRNYRDAEGNAGAFQNSFAVYGRAGEKCVRCGSVLKKITIGGRTSTFCEKCQKS